MIEHIDFFSWFANVENLVLSNGFELMRIVIQRHKNSFFSENLQKTVQRLRALPPDPYSLLLGDPPPDPVSDTFEKY